MDNESQISLDDIQELEKRIDELEERIRGLEEKSGHKVKINV